MSNEKKDVVFINGVRAFESMYSKRLVIDVEEFKEAVREHAKPVFNEFHGEERLTLKIEVKKSKAGKMYVALDTFEPQPQNESAQKPADMPKGDGWS